MRAVEGNLGHPLQYWGGGKKEKKEKQGRHTNSLVLAQRAHIEMDHADSKK
jgi:hypothetical protein